MVFLRELASISVLYWRQPKVSFAQVSLLIASNGVLLVMCKSASFGFDDLAVGVITTLIAFFLQYIASVASLLRGSNGGIQAEAPKLAKAMAIVWLVSLTLFLPNSIPALRWFGVIDSYIVIAFLHSVAAVALVTHYSLRQLKASAVSRDEMAMEKRSAYKWAAFFLLVNTILFQIFVLDSDTHYWVLDNYEYLKNSIV